MILKKIYGVLILCAGIAACQPERCPEGLDQQPMFGHEKKCAAQRNADLRFLDSCDQQFHDRKLAARAYIADAWMSLDRQDFGPALLAFNRAWLLDSTNADIYWGYGNFLGYQQQFRASLPYFRRSISLNPLNPKVYDCMAVSLGQAFVETGQDSFLYQNIGASMQSISLNPSSAAPYANLASAYTYFSQHDSARKYIAIAERLDPDAVNQQVRQVLTKEAQSQQAPH